MKEQYLISAKEDEMVNKTTQNILSAVGRHYHASCAHLYHCGLNNSVALAASWSAQTVLHGDLNITSPFVLKWKEHHGMNQAIYIPEIKSAQAHMASHAEGNLLGVLQGEAEKLSLLLLLRGVAPDLDEKSYDFLETACLILSLGGKLFEEMDATNKKRKSLPKHVEILRSSMSHNLDEEIMTERIKLVRQLKVQKKQHCQEIRRKNEVQKILEVQTSIWVFEWSRKLEGEQDFSLSYISPELAAEFQFYQQDIHLFTYLLVKNRIFEADLERYYAFLDDTVGAYPKMLCRITRDGYDYLWYQLTKRILFDEGEQEEQMIGTVLNVDDKIRAGQQLKRKARIDVLTGLLNQESFYAEAEKLLKDNPDREYAVIIMDIDKFKLINSLYGMNIGNEVLAQIGLTIKNCILKTDLCARVYADVFYIVIAYENDDLIINLIRKIMERLSYVEYGAMLLPCFGISNSKDSERTITSLCELASFAHKHVKGNSRERYTFYNASMRQAIIEEKEMESEMEYALQNGQFQVYLQPKYVISTREVVGAEALVRWEHPTKGTIGPAKFISLFEKNGFILKLDEYIWEQVCAILQRWQAKGVKCIPISVNMSRLHLNNRSFQSSIVNLLERYQISHKWFELELTENLLFENLNQMISVLTGLQNQGFSINMDDFGSGYSSLNMLRNIPIDVLKIDGNFFDEKMLTPKGKTIVKYVVSMAKELNMQVVAEGVENPSQEKFLLEVGCEIAQGFYFSRPMPVATFELKCWHTT